MAYPSFPLSLPATPAFRQSRFSLERRAAVNTSPFTGQQQAHEYSYALWKATLTLPPMKRATAAAWTVFFTQCHGRRGTFLLGDPDATTPRGGISGSPTLGSAFTVGGYDLTIATALSSGANAFKAGDYISIDNYLYMIVADCAADGSGNVSAAVEPAAKTTHSSGSPVVYSSAKGIFRMDSNDLGWDTDFVSKYGFTFSCTEAF